MMDCLVKKRQDQEESRHNSRRRRTKKERSGANVRLWIERVVSIELYIAHASIKTYTCTDRCIQEREREKEKNNRVNLARDR